MTRNWVKAPQGKNVLGSLFLLHSFRLPLSIHIFPSQPYSRVRRVKTEQSMVDSWQKKVFIYVAQHPNIASYLLCVWLSFPGVKWPEPHAFIRLRLVLKIKFWRCSSARSPRTALPYLHIIDLLSYTLHFCSSLAVRRQQNDQSLTARSLHNVFRTA